jgi:hypothetical protein
VETEGDMDDLVNRPVLELQKRLAEKLKIIKCNEFRTTKLCPKCGGELFQAWGVLLYPTESSSHAEQGRLYLNNV